VPRALGREGREREKMAKKAEKMKDWGSGAGRRKQERKKGLETGKEGKEKGNKRKRRDKKGYTAREWEKRVEGKR